MSETELHVDKATLGGRALHEDRSILRKENLLMLVLASIQFTYILDFVIIMPLGPQFMRVFEVSSQQFGLIVSSYTLSAGFSGLIGAFYIDRFDRKPALLTLYAGFAVGTGMCAFAPTYEFLVAARLLAGSFGGVLGSLVLAIVGDIIPYARRGAAMGVITSAFSVASVAGVPTGLYIAAHLGWHATFLALAGLCVLILLVAVWIVPSIRGHLVDSVSRHPLETLKVMLFNRNHTRVFLFVAMLMFGGFTVFPFISPYLVYNLGIQESDLTYVYGLGGLFTIFTSRIIGKLADRYGKPRVFGIVASLSAIPTLAVTSLPAMALPWVLVCTTFFFILASGRSVPAFAMITASVDSSLRGSFMSFNSSIQMWSAGLASFAAGVLITNGPHGELFRYGWVGVMASSSTIACVFLANRLKQPDVSHQ